MKTKIAFFAETLQANYDGAVRTMYQIIQRIPKEQFEFLFICGDDIVEPLPFRTIALPSIGIPFNPSYKMALPYFNNKWLCKQLDEFQVDIVHIATPSPLGHFALQYAQQRQLPTISIYHTHFIAYVDYYLKATPLLIEPIKKAIVKNYKAFYDNCDQVYIPTMEMEKDLAYWGHRTDHFKLWQRGIDTNLFHPSKGNKKQLQQQVGNTKPNILFASRLVWEKNLETLIQLYHLNESKGAPYNILIAGDGVARQALVEQMPHAQFFGQISHEALATLYASADIFFFPSITETYGNVVVEAMASGLPCVIANGGGSKSFITQGINGFLSAPTEPLDYFTRIETLLADKNLYRQFVQNGIAYTRNNSWDNLVDIYFKDLLKLRVPKKAMAA